MLHSIFQTPQYAVIHYMSGDSNDKDVAESLIKQDFRRNA
jgi:hypothetical protein